MTWNRCHIGASSHRSRSIIVIITCELRLVVVTGGMLCTVPSSRVSTSMMRGLSMILAVLSPAYQKERVNDTQIGNNIMSKIEADRFSTATTRNRRLGSFLKPEEIAMIISTVQRNWRPKEKNFELRRTARVAGTCAKTGVACGKRYILHRHLTHFQSSNNVQVRPEAIKEVDDDIGKIPLNTNYKLYTSKNA